MTAIRDRFNPSRIVLRIPLAAHSRLVAAALGVGLAACGQVVIMSERVFDLPVLTPLANAVFSIHPLPTTVFLGVLLLAAGGGLFAASIRSEPRPDDLEGNGPGLGTLADGARRPLFAGLLLLGVASSVFLWVQLAIGNYEDAYPWLWVVSIAVAGGAFLYLDRRSGVNLGLRIGVLEVAFLVVITGTFIGLNLRDLNDWYYSAIGDEYVIFEAAKGVAEGATPNFFSLRGEYDIIPVAQTYYRAAVMDVFGVDYFGWKFASVLAGAAVLAPLYLLVRSRFNVPAAVGAVVLLAASHVQLAYAHTGYSALFALFPTVVAFALFYSALKRGSSFLMFGAGVATGLGFYVLYNARILLPILLLALLVYRGRLGLKRNLPLLALGFALAVIPMVIVAQSELVTLANDQSVFNYNPGIVPDPWDRIKDNALRSPLAFNYSNYAQHFVSGSLLEPITAVLSVLGLAYALRRFTRPTFLLLLMWYAVAMVTSGIASPHPYVPVGRMSYLIPVMVVFAAVALGKGYELVQDIAKNNALRRVVPPLALAVVLLAAVGSNLFRFWYVTPGDVPGTWEALVMKPALSSECRDSDRQTVVVSQGPGGTHSYTISSRDWDDDRTPVILAYDEMERVTEFVPISCVIYWPRAEPQFTADIARLQRLTGAQQVTSEYDHSGEGPVVVLR